MTQFEKPQTEKILAGLKDFQRDAVEHIFERFHSQQDSTDRFLVADEVGLGKTLIARGVIAKTIEHLWDKTDRIDIIYVCSNSDIAKQNIKKLNVLGCNRFSLSSRITLLPIKIGGFERERVNFVSFTPSTSFELNRNGGTAEERALLYWMLKDVWQLNRPIDSRPFEGHSKKNGFQYWMNFLKPGPNRPQIHDQIRQQFVTSVASIPSLRAEYDRLVELLPPRKAIPPKLTLECIEWVGRLRRLLAETCVEWLTPDLIILDEFQRFKHLMKSEAEGGDDSATLAQQLFKSSGCRPHPKVLLLSATPYKMYTTADESSQEDHYKDFRMTLNFLMSTDAQRNRLEQTLKEYRDSFFRVSDQGAGEVQRVKQELEAQLRQFMVRTERLSVDDNQDGMLATIESSHLELTESDVEQYIALQKIASAVGYGEVLEYWKSAPYLLNFMDDYDVKRKVNAAIDAEVQTPGLSLAKLFREFGNGLLNARSIEEYAQVEPGNARLRDLQKNTLGRNVWKLLWIPPSLPYYEPSGVFADEKCQGFTKRLVFSSWKVVPKAVASLLSYEADRLMMLDRRGKVNSSYKHRDKVRRQFTFPKSSGKPRRMTTLGILYPCRTLARRLDPKKFLSSPPQRLDDVVYQLSQEIEKLLEPVIDRYASKLSERGDSAFDSRWYWRAPLLLDLFHYERETRDWLEREDLADVWRCEEGQLGGIEHSGWKAHIDKFVESGVNESPLGNVPVDLSEVLARMALAAPGVVALRSLSRVVDRAEGETIKISPSDYAAKIGHSFVHLFNLPEVANLLRRSPGKKPYWQRVLDYSMEGNIQSMLDEYIHNLVDSEGLEGKPIDEFLTSIAREISSSLSLRTANLQADTFKCTGRRVQSENERPRLRNRFAVPFGHTLSKNNEESSRPDQLRRAFNSPFWPFVLVSTSVGQEGLDFHPYCHAVVHWNLPANPVDLEQREGRVHRFKGHALRKNIAQLAHAHANDPRFKDPWQAMFEHAKETRPAKYNDLYPFWISPAGDAKIERYVPRLPHSREEMQLQHLSSSLVIYRMVFGQHRQEDLVRYLQRYYKPDQIDALAKVCRIDLSPRSVDNSVPSTLVR